MPVNCFTIQNKILKNYIDCIYFTRKAPKEHYNFQSFPTNNHILSIFENGIVEHIGIHKICKQNNSSNFYAELVEPFTSPITVTYLGEINEITIYFKPLGIFYFNIFDKNPVENKIYSLKKESEVFFKNTLKLALDEEKIMVIEAYFLKQFSMFDNRLTSIIDHINKNPSYSIESVCKKFNISRKTLNKIFQKHTGRSPIQFKNTLRFRESIKNNDVNLTQICYDNNYYDQAHMIRDFRKFTNYPPNLFFKKIDKNISKKLKWINI